MPYPNIESIHIDLHGRTIQGKTLAELKKSIKEIGLKKLV